MTQNMQHQSTRTLSLGTALLVAGLGAVITSSVAHAQSSTIQPTTERAIQPLVQEPVADLPKLLPEGTFVPARLGKVVSIATGERLIVFARDASGTSPRPMILLPSPGFDSIVQTINTNDANARQLNSSSLQQQDYLFVCSGRVFVYHNWNYLLPLTVREAVASDVVQPHTPDHTTPDAPSGSAQQSTPDLDVSPIDSLELDPSVSSLIAELEQAQAGPRALATHTGVQSPSAEQTTSAAQAHSALRTYTKDQALMRRTGRIGRIGGAWTFLLDQGVTRTAEPAPSTSFDQPIPILPSQALESIESVVGQYGTAVKIEVTGLIVHTQHRPMLLPSFFQVIDTTELRPIP